MALQEDRGSFDILDKGVVSDFPLRAVVPCEKTTVFGVLCSPWRGSGKSPRCGAN